jgi:1,4-alpha-glucan branching enzyme
MEEDWLYEAIIETYLPLLEVMHSCRDRGLHFRLTMTLSPTLVAMLNDQHLRDKTKNHLVRLIELAEKEIERTRGTAYFDLAVMYFDRFKKHYDFYLSLNEDLVGAFGKLQEQGYLEIITCMATHGFMPAIGHKASTVKGQLITAVEDYKRNFGMEPRGIWLPECGYIEGIEDDLRKAGIRFFFTDTHGVMFAEPFPKYGVYAPAYLRNGVAAFARDYESSHSVWSANEGYPGDGNYREFYRDIGFDLDFDYIRPYIDPTGIRLATGIKYHKITNSDCGLPQKDVYNEQNALNKAREHAQNFFFNREKQIEHLSSMMDRPPLITSIYDAELFGHWWFEGPLWIQALIEKMNEVGTIEMITPAGYLQKHPRNQVVKMFMSSWGNKGYGEVWINGSNDWMYRQLYPAARKMKQLALRAAKNSLDKRALNQAARELLLAQSSDWPFIVNSGTAKEYAEKRFADHIKNFNQLSGEIERGSISVEFLEYLEDRNNLFPEINYQNFAK